MPRRILLTCILALLLAAPLPLRAQDGLRELIDMRVEAGFGGFFRPGKWLPLRVELANNGESLAGRVVVRPETSGTVVGNAFSTPVDLPSGAQKTATLYIQARSFPDRLRVELIDTAGDVRAMRETPLIDLALGDLLAAVVTSANRSVPNFAAMHIGGGKAEQTLLQVHELPDRAQGLEALDVIALVNCDSEDFTAAQRKAIRRWLADGGHLIIAGGPGARSTIAGFDDILPLRTTESLSLDNLAGLAAFAGDYENKLDERAVVETGAAHAGSRVLAEQDGMPLLLRRTIGAGAVDYLAADPTLQPLARWENLDQLWLHLLATREPHPAWTRGITRGAVGAEAVANLPGVDLLPPLQALCLFLAAYVLLIGPVNYFVLSRINRAGYAWLTIPLVIIVFTVIAWTVGFNLRGAEIIVSRLTLVQAHADVDEARVDQLLGLLSPRRATYAVDAPADHFLAVAGATNPSSLFASNTIQTGTEITQTSRFGAADFTIDGGIFANFAMRGAIVKPALSGSFVREFEMLENGRLAATFQGLLRNDSDIALRDAAILGQGLVHHLDGELKPGDIITFDSEQLVADVSDYAPQPNPLEARAAPPDAGNLSFSSGGINTTVRAIQGERYLRSRAFINAMGAEERQATREQSFLASFAQDFFRSTSRGGKLYLVGWSDAWPRDLEIRGAAWSSIDTTLYIIELEVETRKPRATVTLPSGHFSWMTLSRDGVAGNGTEQFTLYEGHSVEFLLAPQPGLELDRLRRLHLEVDRGGGYGQSLDIQVYDWAKREYEAFGFREGDELDFAAPSPFVGPLNMLRLRLAFDQGAGTARVRQIRIQQTGAYD